MVSTNDVGLTAGMRGNLLLLQKTNSQIETIQGRLATGNKINSALDGPTSFFAAKSLTQRAGDLSTLKEAMGQAISTIKAGDKGITSIESLLEQARGLTTTAYGNLGLDAASVATRKSLAQQFNAIKDQIDKIARDSGYQGKNLLVGDGRTLDATAASRTAVNSIVGVSNSRVTNVISTDTYSIKVSGTGAISGNSSDIAKAEDGRGITSLKLSGGLSATSGNFSDVSIEMRGSVGRERTVVITEGGESRSIKFFDNTQAVNSTLAVAGKSGVAQQSTVSITGAIEEGDSFTVTVNGRAISYTASASDVVSASPTDRQAAIAEKLRAKVEQTLGATSNLGASAFTISAASPGSTTFTITASATTGTAVSFSLGTSANNALTKDISLSFSSGTVVSFTIDRAALEALGTGGNGTSTIEKNVDLTVTATNLNGVSVSRSAANDRGAGKLTAGENSLSFDTGTVRFNVDDRILRSAASASAFANLSTVQRTDPNTSNDLTVQFNESNTNFINVVSRNIQTDGQGLRLDFAQNGFLDRTDIDKAVKDLDFAKSALRSASQGLSTNLNVIQTRETFTKEFSDVLTEGSNKLIQADQNEEGANLLLLQTRQQLGTISLSLANQAQQAILRLF
ncbi:MAG TPA: flagellin [Azospirillaceae bacterium]|nr:flagellin [Azospirillaceae bacterium]